MSLTAHHLYQTCKNQMKTIQLKNLVAPILGGVILIGLITVLSLSITILVEIDKQSRSQTDNDVRSLYNPKLFFQPPVDINLAASIHMDEVMSYLNEFQRIASANNDTRAIGSTGFNSTIDYINDYLTANTNFKITKTLFPVLPTRLAQAPIFISSINGVQTNHTYSQSELTAEFYQMEYTTSTNFNNYVEIVVIPNVGCKDSDWQTTNLSPQNRVALVKRGDCSFVEKSALAAKYKALAILIYNDGTTPNRTAVISGTLAENNTVPALFLTFELGQKLAEAAERAPGSVSVLISIVRLFETTIPVANVCADTPTGDATQTIVVGSHSDSVPAGPGINDNGSGSAANLALAVALARLFRTSTYPKYKYRVRFCWWGAEEVGLLGSKYHVAQAKNSTVTGERLSDYLVNLNYDMLGSPNYIFGIYDGRTARNDTPEQALTGSNRLTDLYKDWFIKQNLPWDYTDFSGRSDYGPFLAEGIVAGGLFSGADDKKTEEQRNRYDHMLGQGFGGIPDVIYDPCYHKACDSIQNINVFGYKKMIQAAAYVLEYLGRHQDLKTWLYPSTEIHQFTARSYKAPTTKQHDFLFSFE